MKEFNISSNVKVHSTAVLIVLTAIFLIACGENNQNNSSTTNIVDSLESPVEGNTGVPLNNLDRSMPQDTTVSQPSSADSKSGLPLDDLNRDKSDDTDDQPINNP